MGPRHNFSTIPAAGGGGGKETNSLTSTLVTRDIEGRVLTASTGTRDQLI